MNMTDFVITFCGAFIAGVGATGISIWVMLSVPPARREEDEA